jgi:hypothetical protein
MIEIKKDAKNSSFYLIEVNVCFLSIAPDSFKQINAKLFFSIFSLTPIMDTNYIGGKKMASIMVRVF